MRLSSRGLPTPDLDQCKESLSQCDGHSLLVMTVGWSFAWLHFHFCSVEQSQVWWTSKSYCCYEQKVGSRTITWVHLELLDCNKFFCGCRKYWQAKFFFMKMIFNLLLGKVWIIVIIYQVIIFRKYSRNMLLTPNQEATKNYVYF